MKITLNHLSSWRASENILKSPETILADNVSRSKNINLVFSLFAFSFYFPFKLFFIFLFLELWG